MNRPIKLDKEWYKYATEPMIGKIKNEGTAVALIPDFTGGYTYIDFAVKI